MTNHYSMLIQWSNEDRVYVVSLPEFGPYCSTHGNTYEEAAKHGREVLETLIELYQEEGKRLPVPNQFSLQEPSGTGSKVTGKTLKIPKKRKLQKSRAS